MDRHIFLRWTVKIGVRMDRPTFLRWTARIGVRGQTHLPHMDSKDRCEGRTGPPSSDGQQG